MAWTLFPRIPFACRALLAPASPHQRRRLSTFDVIRRVIIGSPAHELFSPTDCRWLWNEKRQMAQHTRTFNIPALKAAAAEVLGVAHWRVRLIKRGDGGSNKVIAAWGGGNRWVIIKLPDPILPARVVTASEVALMEFVRTELDIRAPKVLKWSCDAGGPVGAEYVIMEEVEEEMAVVRWPEIGLEGKARVLKGLLAIDEKFLRSGEIFKDVGYGSLYFTEDAEKLGFKKVFEVRTGSSPGRFCLGPLAEEHFWVDAAADIDRGPWLTPQAYLTAIADASLHHLTLGGEPTAKTKPFMIDCRRTSDQVLSTAHTTLLLNRFRSLASGLVDPTLSAPTLWHRDLNHRNIFVDSTGSISSIVDWQGVHVLPLFLQARIPGLFRYTQSDPEVVPDPLSPLGDDLLGEDSSFVQDRIEIIALAKQYVNRLCTASGGLGEELRPVLEKQRIPMSRKLSVSVATSTFETSDDTLLLWALLERVMREWEKIAPGTECPSKLEENEMAMLEDLGGFRNSWLDLLDMHEMPRGDDASVTIKEFENEKSKVKKFVRDILTEGLEGDEFAEQRERFIRHLKSWDLTDWNDGKGWIDGVGEELNTDDPMPETKPTQ